MTISRSTIAVRRETLRLASICIVVASVAAPAAGEVSVIDFDTFLDGTPIGPADGLSTQWAGIGVVFANESGLPIAVSNNACSLTAPNHAFASVIVATFVDPCTGAPTRTASAGTAQDTCWFPGEGIDMKAFDSEGRLLAQQFNAGGGNLVVFSFERPVIARIEMTCVLQGIDNFQFASVVPVHPPDLNGDGQVSGMDITFLLSAWGECVDCCAADFNLDGVVDGFDLTSLLSNWTG